MFPRAGSLPLNTDPGQHIVVEGWDLDNLDRDLSNLCANCGIDFSGKVQPWRVDTLSVLLDSLKRIAQRRPTV